MDGGLGFPRSGIDDYAPCHVGDILYVRETWQVWRAHRYEATVDISFKAGGYGRRLFFKNGGTDSINRDDYDRFVEKWYPDYKWHPAIHMPKEAARLFLRVTDVRCERLQDITEEDAKKEGIGEWFIGMGESGFAVSPHSSSFYESPIGAFAALWNSTLKHVEHIKYCWSANPWVWVIEFERCDKPNGRMA